MGTGSSKVKTLEQPYPVSLDVRAEMSSDSHILDEDVLEEDPDEKEARVARDEHQHYLANMLTLKGIFKKLDPAVMKTSQNVHGDIKVSIKFLSEKSLLLVKIIQAQDLLANDLRGQSSDPYVKIDLFLNKLLQESELGVPRSTTVAENTRNPVFNEIFSFALAPEKLDSAHLRLSVLSNDKLGENDDFIGERHIYLKEIDCLEKASTSWYSLQPEIDISVGGEIGVKLEFKLPQTLTVSVSSASNLKEMNQSAEPYVRIYIPGVPYLYKTKPYKGNEDPVWNESFDFPIAKEELSEKYVVMIVADANDESSYLGECHVDMEMFQPDRVLDTSFDLSDMRASVAVRSRWAQNTLSQEFQEALLAHAQYKKPNILFSRVHGAGNRAITVRIPKADAHSRLRLVNGVLVH